MNPNTPGSAEHGEQSRISSRAEQAARFLDLALSRREQEDAERSARDAEEDGVAEIAAEAPHANGPDDENEVVE